MATFRNNFQDQSGLLKHLLESQAAIGKPEKDSWRGLPEVISSLVSDLINGS